MIAASIALSPTVDVSKPFTFSMMNMAGLNSARIFKYWR